MEVNPKWVVCVECGEEAAAIWNPEFLERAAEELRGYGHPGPFATIRTGMEIRGAFCRIYRRGEMPEGGVELVFESARTNSEGKMEYEIPRCRGKAVNAAD